MLRIDGSPGEREMMCGRPAVPRKRCAFPAVPAEVKPQVVSRKPAALPTSSTCSSTLCSRTACCYRGLWRSLLCEAEHQARRADRLAALERLKEFRPGKSGLQVARLERSGDESGDVMLRRVAL